MKVEPRPVSLCAWISPPSSRAISREMDSPRPVPPYLRLVVPSACLNASKMTRILLAAMPMPVSVTENAIRSASGSCSEPASSSCSRMATGTSVPAGRMTSSTAPVSVNFTALDSRLRSTCSRRCSSVCSVAGSSGDTRTEKSRPFSAVSGRKVAST